MPIDKRLVLSTILSLVLVLLTSALNADVRLAEKYSADSKCQEITGGELTLSFSDHMYSFASSDTGDVAEPSSFSFTCGGKLNLEGSLEVWGEGRIQDDGTVVFSCIVLTPEPQVSIWPFSCNW